MLNKLIHSVIPEANNMKGTLELVLEVFGQTSMMLLGLVFIQRLITFIPTYSGDDYKTTDFLTIMLPFLMIILSLQTKMGEKCNILYTRALDMWNGKRGFENFDDDDQEDGSGQSSGGRVTATQPIATLNSNKTEAPNKPLPPQAPQPVNNHVETRPGMVTQQTMQQTMGPNPLDSGISAYSDMGSGFGAPF